MRTRRALAAISAAQLTAGLAGMTVAVRQGRSFDIALLRWRGRPERIRRDRWLLGTGLSAPIAMLATQAVASARLAAVPSRRAARTLGLLGAGMTCGYLVEREFRAAFTAGGVDPVITPIAAAGFGLALPMAVLGLRSAEPVARHGSRA